MTFPPLNMKRRAPRFIFRRGTGALCVASSIVTLAFFVSCVVDDIDFSSKGCPCPEPLVCDVARNQCVASSLAGGGEGGSPTTAECPAGFGDCDGDRVKNGCETDLTKSIGHCGRCGNVCAGGASAFPVCRNSKCELGCNVGVGNCDNDPTNGCETDTTQNAKHCGACNHDCLGGACTKGFCEASPVASGLDGPTSIALDATHIYWRAKNTLQRIPKVGGAVQTLTNTTASAGAGPVVDGAAGRVYYTDGKSTYVCGTSSCPSPRLIGTVAGTPMVLGLDPENLWVSENVLNNSRLHFVPRSTDDAGLAIRNGGVGMGFNLATTSDSSAVYWVRLNGVLVALRKTASSVEPLSPALPGISGSFDVAVFGDQAFFSAYNASDANAIGAIYQCSTAGCTVPTEFMPQVSAPYGVAIDGTFVYAIAQGTPGNQNTDGKVLRCSLQGCGLSGPTPLAINQKLASYVAVDQTHVYWVTETQIMRVAK